MGFGKTSKGLGTPIQISDNSATAADDTRVILDRVSEQAAPAIPEPIVATDAEGKERPLSGGSFVRVDGKLQRREA